MDLSETTAADLVKRPPNVVLANVYPFRPGESIGDHASSSVMLVAACTGRGRLELADGDLELSPGQVLVLPWMAPRRYLADRSDPFRILGVHLAPGDDRPRHVDTPIPRRSTPAASRLPVLQDTDLSLRAAMEVAERAFARPPGAFRDAALRGCGLALAATVAAGLRGQSVRPNAPAAPALAGLESWMRLSLARRISRSELARRARLSPSHLAAGFKRAYGRAPLAHLQELRLVEARRLLQSSDASVAAVAAAVGFSDPFWFSRVFHRRWGAPPRAMRRL
jgi:AraC family transcriptional regulator, arabinose operon regulatory protein